MLKKSGLIALLIVLALAMHDISVSPQRAFGARAAIGAIDSYRAHISPHLRGHIVCRFKPTCSAYGRESIRKHGLLIGGAKTVKRIAKCGPWTKMGTVDPP
jgi:putative membrane protein insertion efficiency factor